MTTAALADPAIAEYAAHPAVRQRIAEFVSVGGAAAASALAEGEVFRTLADPEGALLLLDVDYVHPADPSEPWRQPERCFARLRHAHEAALAAFARRGLAPLVLLGATGYRYLARVPRDGRLYAALAALGGGDGWAATACRSEAGRTEEAAYRGAGRVVELLAHDVVRGARSGGLLSVALADVPPAGSDPFVRVDPCAYAESAAAVHIRAPFSADRTGLVVLPAGRRALSDLLPARVDLARAAALAESSSAVIPDVPDDSALLRDYERSALAAFHAEMDRAPLAADWSRHAAGLFDPESAPPCVSAVLRYPAPRLREPRHLRTVALALWSTGWHPRSIAALVRERYEEPHDWGTHWQRSDPARTAAYYVRLFCAAAACGLDDGRFSCETQARHALCPAGGCGYDLGVLFRRLRTLRARDEVHA